MSPVPISLPDSNGPETSSKKHSMSPDPISLPDSNGPRSCWLEYRSSLRGLITAVRCPFGSFLDSHRSWGVRQRRGVEFADQQGHIAINAARRRALDADQRTTHDSPWLLPQIRTCLSSALAWTPLGFLQCDVQISARSLKRLSVPVGRSGPCQTCSRISICMEAITLVSSVAWRFGSCTMVRHLMNFRLDGDVSSPASTATE